MPSENRARTRSSFPHTPLEIERAPARYLFAISVLSGSGEDRTTTGELHEYLDVTPASVTEMLSRLDDRGLVDYETYRGVTLTDQGEALAVRVGWRVCVVTTFFDSEQDTHLDERTAFDIGFVLPKNSVSRLQERSGSPCLDLCPEARNGVDTCSGERVRVRIDAPSKRTCSATPFFRFVSFLQKTMSTSHDHDHSEAEPVTDRMHDNSWSANLEKPQHAADVDLVVSRAVDAIEHTEPGNHVNLVTHGDLGHPSEYLYGPSKSGSIPTPWSGNTSSSADAAAT